MTDDEKELSKIIIRAQAKQHGDEETLSTVAERAYRLGRETEQRETASLRHAALFAAGVRGGPGAWRWSADPTGTILTDEAAWERLLGEMRERTGRRAPVQGEHNKRDRGPGTIAWDEHVLAWSAYAVRYGRDQSAERIAERGGFGYAELTSLLGHEPKTWTPASE